MADSEYPAQPLQAMVTVRSELVDDAATIDCEAQLRSGRRVARLNLPKHTSLDSLKGSFGFTSVKNKEGGTVSDCFESLSNR